MQAAPASYAGSPSATPHRLLNLFVSQIVKSLFTSHLGNLKTKAET